MGSRSLPVLDQTDFRSDLIRRDLGSQKMQTPPNPQPQKQLVLKYAFLASSLEQAEQNCGLPAAILPSIPTSVQLPQPAWREPWLIGTWLGYTQLSLIFDTQTLARAHTHTHIHTPPSCQTKKHTSALGKGNKHVREGDGRGKRQREVLLQEAKRPLGSCQPLWWRDPLQPDLDVDLVEES